MRAAEERLQFELVEFRLGGVELLAQLGDEGWIFIAHFDERFNFVASVKGLVHGLEERIEAF